MTNLELDRSITLLEELLDECDDPQFFMDTAAVHLPAVLELAMEALARRLANESEGPLCKDGQEILSTDIVNMPEGTDTDTWIDIFAGPVAFFYDPSKNGGKAYIDVTDPTGRDHKVLCSRVERVG